MTETFYSPDYSSKTTKVGFCWVFFGCFLIFLLAVVLFLAFLISVGKGIQSSAESALKKVPKKPPTPLVKTKTPPQKVESSTETAINTSPPIVINEKKWSPQTTPMRPRKDRKWNKVGGKLRYDDVDVSFPKNEAANIPKRRLSRATEDSGEVENAAEGFRSRKVSGAEANEEQNKNNFIPADNDLLSSPIFNQGKKKETKNRGVMSPAELLRNEPVFSTSTPTNSDANEEGKEDKDSANPLDFTQRSPYERNDD